MSKTKRTITPEIAEDGRCKCTCATPCPLGTVGTTYRCTKEELESAGVEYTMEAENLDRPKIKREGDQ